MITNNYRKIISIMTFDKFDYKILKELQKNARIAYATIGKDIGLTAPAVAKRVQKMENRGLIKGYQLNVDHTKLGKAIKAFVSIKIGFAQMQSFKKAITNFEAIQACYRVTGDDCMMMEILLKDNLELVEFLDAMAQYGITKTSIVLNNLLKET